MSMPRCYDIKKLLKTFVDGRTPLDVADAAEVPAKDRLRMLLYGDVLGDNALRLLACDFAEKALPAFERRFPGDMRPRQAIDTARRFALGNATAEEMAAAFLGAEGARDDAFSDGLRVPDSGAWFYAAVAAEDAAYVECRVGIGMAVEWLNVWTRQTNATAWSARDAAEMAVYAGAATWDDLLALVRKAL